MTRENLSAETTLNGFTLRKRANQFALEYAEREGEFKTYPEPPWEAYRALREKGLINWWVSQELGGPGISVSDGVKMVEELAWLDAGIAFASFTSILAGRCITLFGNDVHKEFVMRQYQSGGFAALAASEHEAGSELMRMDVTATRKGSVYAINGVKAYCTNADFADYVVVIASVPDETPAFRALVVPRNTPGLSIVKRWSMWGLAASCTYELKFEDCQVSEDLAIDGNGFQILETALITSRLLVASLAVGISSRIRDLYMGYSESKSLKGSTLAKNPVSIAKVGQMQIYIDAMRMVCESAAQEYDQIFAMQDRVRRLRRSTTMKAVAAQQICGELGWKIASEGTISFGGMGYTTEHLMHKLAQDMRFVTLLEAGKEVAREIAYGRYATVEYQQRAR